MFVLRVLGSIVAGILVAFALLIAVELFSAVVHPLPADFQHTAEDMCAHVARYPAWVLAAVVPMWAGIAFIAPWLAARIGGLGCGVFIAVLLFAGFTWNVAMLPYPMWFKAAIPLAVPAAAFPALRLASAVRSPSIASPVR